MGENSCGEENRVGVETHASMLSFKLTNERPNYVWCEKQIQSRLACWRFQNENALDECGLFGTGQSGS